MMLRLQFLREVLLTDHGTATNSPCGGPKEGPSLASLVVVGGAVGAVGIIR